MATDPALARVHCLYSKIKRMGDKPLDRKQLETRRADILEQLDRLEEDLRIELDRDPEEQAIQVEQNEVSITMEQSLRRELATIEEELAAMAD